MRLRTTAGAYVGEIRDYSFSAAQAALKTGTAEPIDAEHMPAPTVTATSGTEPTPTTPRRGTRRTR